jgi:predicted nucleic acid-binding protein
VEILVQSPSGRTAIERLPETEVAAPEMIDIEVLAALRKMVLHGTMRVTRAELALGALRAFPVERFPHGDLLERAWELRDGVRPYDALYLALAEALNVPLWTADRPLSKTTLAHVPIECFAP